MSVNGHSLEFTQIPLAPLRWEHLEITVDGLVHPDEFSARVTSAVNELHSRLVGARHLTHVQAVGLRVKTVGRTNCHRDLVAHLDSPDGPTRLRQVKDEVLYFVDKVSDASVPLLDLQAIAKQTDPPGLLAQKLVLLQGGTSGELVAAAKRQMSAEANNPRWAAAGVPEFTDDVVRDYLLRAGYFALEELLAQQEVQP